MGADGNGTAVVVRPAGALVPLEEARRLLAEAKSVDVVKDIRDKAAYVSHYRRQRDLSLEAANDAAEIKVRAERRLGELLAETVHPGNPQLSADSTIGRLPDGVTRDQSSQWQRIARIPLDVFENHVVAVRQQADGELTTAGVLSVAKQLERDEKAGERVRRMQTVRADLGPDGWHRGDWRDHVPGIPDGSVAVVLTDPPYGLGYQSDFRLDRRLERRHDPIANDTPDAPAEIQAALTALFPKLRDHAHVFVFCHWSNEPEVRKAVEAAGLTLRGRLIWAKNNTGMGDPATTFAPKHEGILHAVKGSPVLFRREPDLLEADRVPAKDHPTEKPVSLLQKLIEVSTAPGDMVADPFGGVASTLVAAKECGRRYWGCELVEEYWAHGSERLAAG